METLLQLYAYGGLFSNILLILLVIVWIYFILWVAKDISWRTNNFWLQLISILLILFLTPIFWLPIYMLIRPVHSEPELRDQDFFVSCFSCGGHNDKEFAYCVYCCETLKVACQNCEQPVWIDYTFCAWCGDKVELPDE